LGWLSPGWAMALGAPTGILFTLALQTFHRRAAMNHRGEPLS